MPASSGQFVYWTADLLLEILVSSWRESVSLLLLKRMYNFVGDRRGLGQESWDMLTSLSMYITEVRVRVFCVNGMHIIYMYLASS